MQNALSPLDGRYESQVNPLREFFSEEALMRYRVHVEIEYFIALSHEPRIKELPRLKPNHTQVLRRFYERFSAADASRIKTIEQKTKHDVKAVEYFLQEKFSAWGLKKYVNFIHFGLTSYDVNNTAYALMLRDGLTDVTLPNLKSVHSVLSSLARKHANIPMLARTHGQPASPTTLGKELAVFAHRLEGQMETLRAAHFYGKLSGATGNWNALHLACPSVNWIAFSKRFLQNLNLEFNPLTTQIEPYDDFAAVFDATRRCNTILIDLCRDLWTYISLGYFSQTTNEHEVGSSAMPHKVNPIDFENAEGNLGLANALFNHLSNKLPISRLQRDLSDSTVLRNLGIPFGHSLIAYTSIRRGLSRLKLNKDALAEDLEKHPEVITEGIQTMLRKTGASKPYEQLRKLAQGKDVSLDDIADFIEKLDIDDETKKLLLKLSPENYIGIASKLVRYM